MRVKTLNKTDLELHAQHLERQCIGYHPDLIVGVERGGVYVAAGMFVDTAHTSVKACRPSTAGKTRHKKTMSLLKVMPQWALNVMRVAEAHLLRLSPPRNVTVNITDDARQAISKARRILVVDDAIDSGTTLRGVITELSTIVNQHGNRPEIRTAVITVTTSRPAIDADYYIYKNATLIRFPWSADYTDERHTR